MFKSKLFEVHHNLFPQYEYAYTKWWKWFKFFINIATAAFAVLAEIFLVGSLGSKAIDTAIPIFLAGRSVRALRVQPQEPQQRTSGCRSIRSQSC